MASRIRQAVILCGGLGSRLGSLTQTTIKPLLPVGGTPFLQLLLFEIARFGITRILFLASHQAESISSFAAHACPAMGLEHEVAVEPSLSGTGGALWHARERLDERFLLFNGDSWFDINLLDLALPFHGDTPVVMALREVEDASRYGAAKLAEGWVTAFSEKGVRPGTPGLVNGGVYAMNKSIVDHLSASCSLEQVLMSLAPRGGIAGRRYTGFFLDIGVPDDYARSQQAIPAARTRGAVMLDRDGVLNEDRGYVGDVSRFAWLPGAREAVKSINDRGFFAFVVTNQAGVARGYYEEGDVVRLHAHMQDDLAAIGAHIDDFRYCPHHCDGTVEGYAKECDWRKPQPGMLKDLLARWPVDAGRTIMIGDQDHDVEAGHRAGIPSHKLMRNQALGQLLDKHFRH